MAKFENNLTEGSLFRQLILFSLPFLCANLLQAFYNVADMIIIGRLAGSVHMSGVSTGSQTIYVLTSAISGFSVSGTVTVAQYMGSSQKKDMYECIQTLFSLLIVSALTITAGMLLFTDSMLWLLNTPEEAWIATKQYYMITLSGTIFIFMYNGLSAVMRGMGNSITPLCFVGCACLLNVILDLIAIGVFHLGAAGAALSTVLSQAASVLLCISYLRKHQYVFDFKLSSFCLIPEKARLILRLGLPSAIQFGLTNAAFLTLTAMANSIDVLASAAIGASTKINSFAIQPCLAMSSSITSVSAQNFGAGKQKRALNAMWFGFFLMAVYGTLMFLIVRGYPTVFLGIFNQELGLLEYGIPYLCALSFDWIAVPLHFALIGLFASSGHTLYGSVSSVVSSLALRIPIASYLAFHLNWGIAGLGYSAGITSVILCVTDVIFFLSGHWKRNIVITSNLVSSEKVSE